MALQYVGFPNTAGVPAAISDEDSYRSTNDRTYCRRWTADEAGTITGLDIYFHSSIDCEIFLVVYRQVNGSGDIDKIAQMDLDKTYSTSQWQGYEPAVVHGAESLDFVSGDILWFGIAGDEGTGGYVGLSRDLDDTTGEVYAQYNTNAVNPTTGPNNTLTFSTSGSGRGLCAILRYDDDVGGESIPIPIVMHHLTKNIGA